MVIKTIVVNTPFGIVSLILEYTQSRSSFIMINFIVQYPNNHYQYDEKNIVKIINNFYCEHSIRRSNCKNCSNYIYKCNIGLCIHNLYRSQCSACKILRQIDESFIFDIFYYIVINYNLTNFTKIIKIIDDINKNINKYLDFMSHIKQYFNYNKSIISHEEVIYDKNDTMHAVSRVIYSCDFNVLIQDKIIKFINNHNIIVTEKVIKNIADLININIKNNIESSISDILNNHLNITPQKDINNFMEFNDLTDADLNKDINFDVYYDFK